MNLDKELYELTGWHRGKSTFVFNTDDPSNTEIRHYYDTDYLLDKLQGYVELVRHASGLYSSSYYLEDGIKNVANTHGDTPREALLRLAIKLKKQGVL